MRSSRWMCLVTVATILEVVCGRHAGSQAVRGVVRDAAGVPVPSVVVLLSDTTGRVISRALSGEAGRFRVAANQSGRFVIVTRRIGFRPSTSAPFTLTSGQELEQTLVVSGIRAMLDTVQVTARTSCAAGLDRDGAAFLVLDQARTALTAAQVTAATRGVQATTLTYERSLDPVRQRVMSQRQSIRTDYVTQPWQAATPAKVHDAGYVVRNRDGSSTFHAPSLDVLLSDDFVGDHCFRVSANGGDDVTLHFEPTRDRGSLVEIRGDIILSRSSAELRGVAFEYVGLRREEEGHGGGRLELMHMRNAGWTINRWEVRMPALEQVERPAGLGGPTIRVHSVEATGGELILATIARAGAVGRDTIWSQPTLRLTGIVRDSSSGQPLVGAHLELVGVGRDATTDARGEFSFDDVLLGSYTASVRTPSLERAGLAVQQAVDFTNPKTRIELHVPTADQIRQVLCGTAPTRDASGVITGQVTRAGDSLGVAGADVDVTWTDIVLRDEHGIGAQSRPVRIAGKTDATGRFRMCNVPLTGAWITASAGKETSAEQPVAFTGERLARIDLSLDRALSGRARLIAHVSSANEASTPIAGAELTFADQSRTFSTNSAGVIDAAGLSAGDHRATIRRLGYAPLDTTLTLRDGAIVELNVGLTRARTLDSVVVSARALDPALRSFEENMRLGVGHFMTRARLAELKAQPLRRALSELQGVSFVHGRGTDRAWVISTRQPAALCARVAPGGTSECHRSHGIYDPPLAEVAQGMAPSCYAKVYVDGLLMNRGNPTPPFDANELLTDQIEAIEYYASASEVPLQYAGLNTDCGVLVIHGRRP